MNSKTSIEGLLDEESNLIYGNFYALIKLLDLNKLKQKNVSLACLNAKQIKNSKYKVVTKDYFDEKLKTVETSITNTFTFIVSNKSDIEEEAENQLKNVPLVHKDVLFSIGMPDLHPGRGYPIGSSIITSQTVYPPLIGTDIGWGMSFIKTKIPAGKAKGKTIEKWVKNLRSIDVDIDWDHVELAKFPLKWGTEENVPELEEFGQEFFNQLGTIGAGNHFWELQAFDEILDEEEFDRSLFDMDKAYVLVHSGSRGYGHDILDKFITEFQDKGIKGLTKETPEYEEYMARHNDAWNYARRNRALIAYRFLKELIGDGLDEEAEGNLEEEKTDILKDLERLNDVECIIDIWHNYVEEVELDFPNPQDVKDLKKGEYDWELHKQKVLIHRKGATPSTQGYVVIPGSRGSYSYLVKPINENSWVSGYSLAHGAGRKMSRSKALASGKHHYKNVENLLKTQFDSRVVWENKDLLYEEAPEAYKKVEDIVHDLASFNLIKIVAVLRPLLTYKFKKDERKNSL